MAGPLHARKSSTGWGRLKPVSDPLDSVGFTSKGDTKLLETKAQESYYSKIVARYMQFCAVHSKDLDAAFSSLPISSSGDAARNPPASLSLPLRPAAPSPSTPASKSPTHPGTSPNGTPTSSPKLKPGGSPASSSPSPTTELSTLLLALRKLREAILATSSETPVPFSQRVHIFSIRLSLLAQHPPSYFPSLLHLLFKLHTPTDPLTPSDLKEFTTYLILDYACRQANLVAAFELRARFRATHGFKSELVDQVLSSLVHDHWVTFWRLRKEVDGYTRAVMDWAADGVRRRALKSVARTYLSVDVKWIVEGCAGGDESFTWESLAEKEGLGWKREGDKIVIKKPRAKVDPKKDEKGAA